MGGSRRSDGDGSSPDGLPRLTRRQMALVQDFAKGHDITTVAERRGRGLSATYELADRICTRLGLSGWQEIGPWAVEHGVWDGDGDGSVDAGSLF